MRIKVGQSEKFSELECNIEMVGCKVIHGWCQRGWDATILRPKLDRDRIKGVMVQMNVGTKARGLQSITLQQVFHITSSIVDLRSPLSLFSCIHWRFKHSLWLNVWRMIIFFFLLPNHHIPFLNCMHSHLTHVLNGGNLAKFPLYCLFFKKKKNKEWCVIFFSFLFKFIWILWV